MGTVVLLVALAIFNFCAASWMGVASGLLLLSLVLYIYRTH